MKNKFKSAPALLCFLSFCLLPSRASPGLSTGMSKSQISSTQGGRDVSSKSNVLPTEVYDVGFRFPKEQLKNGSSSTPGHDDLDYNSAIKPCNLTTELLEQAKVIDGSAWLINNTILDKLNNDPQELIKCTKFEDRLVFSLTGVHKFKQTMVVSHPMEFVVEALEEATNDSELRSAATFTCPDNGPFMRIKFDVPYTDVFSASGFVVQNCTKSAGEGAIVIQSLWVKVTFENTMISYNQNRAIHVDSSGFLTLESCYLKNNSVESANGGAIHAQDDVVLTIDSSSFDGNVADKGGAIVVLNLNKLEITNTTFSGNNARDSGGAIWLGSRNRLTITNTIISENQAKRDGSAIYLVDDNSLDLSYTTLLGNRAGDSGAIWLSKNNKLQLTNTMLSHNHVEHEGGAIRAEHANDLKIMHTTLSRNQAKRNGGAISLESNSTLTLEHTILSGNRATRGGAISSDANCTARVSQSTLERNEAIFGGCFHGDDMSLEVKDCECCENLSSNDGGCFYLESSNATFEGNKLTLNHANNSGGGIFASVDANLRIRNTSLISNSANHGGGVSLLHNSTLLCISCLFETNLANQGGGLYVLSTASHILLGQLTMSIFRGNKASSYGGGMIVKTYGMKTYDCKNLSTPCDRIVLDGTRFLHNIASMFGSIITGTKPDNILVNCEAKYAWMHGFMDKDMIRLRLNQSILTTMDPKKVCNSWEDDCFHSDTCKASIGTFAYKVTVKTDSNQGAQIVGNHHDGFMFKNVESGRPLPEITITTLDAFESTCAPILVEENALILNYSEASREQIVRCNLENGTRTIVDLIGFVLRKNYTIQIYPRNDYILKATTLTILVRNCSINEVSTWSMRLCEKCDLASYNFNLSSSAKCRPCPENANCTKRYIKPKHGYWHKSPCHGEVKRCIVEEACEVQDRLEKLDNLTRNLDDCNLNDTLLSNYSKVQCREGYKGPLCGSCEESYGRSSNSECSKCAHDVIIGLRFIGAIVYLLVGTILTIKGVVPSNSSQQGYEDVEAPLLEHDNTTSMDVASSSQEKVEVEDRNQDLLKTIVEGDVNLLNSSSQEQDEVEVTKQKLVSSWKISLNYFQVTSTAAGMEVEWTKRILDLLQGLNILGAATTDSISYSFDCWFSSTSNGSKAIWRLLFSLIVPLIVISLLSLHWGYKSMTRHGGNLGYFFRRLTLTVVTVAYATYFDLTQVAISTFSCIKVHANAYPFSNAIIRYWTGDTSIECYKDTHIILICISLVIVAFVTLGFPLFSSFTLSQHKSEVRDTSSWTHDTLGFLGGPFKQQFIYWECVTMIKKASLSIIIVFSYSLEVQSQGLLILLVLVFFLYIHFLCYPYDNEYHTLNYYESGSLLVSCVTYTLIQFFNVDKFSEVARSIVSLSIIAINVGFVCLMAYKIVRDLIHLLRALLKSQSIYIPNNMNLISLIRVYSRKRKSSHDA